MLKAELCTLTTGSRKQRKLSDNHVAVKCAIFGDTRSRLLAIVTQS